MIAGLPLGKSCVGWNARIVSWLTVAPLGSHDDQASFSSCQSYDGSCHQPHPHGSIYSIMTSMSFGDNNGGLQVGGNSGLIKAEIHLSPGEIGARQYEDRLANSRSSFKSDQKLRLTLYQPFHSRVIVTLSVVTYFFAVYARKILSEGRG